MRTKEQIINYFKEQGYKNISIRDNEALYWIYLDKVCCFKNTFVASYEGNYETFYQDGTAFNKSLERDIKLYELIYE